MQRKVTKKVKKSLTIEEAKRTHYWEIEGQITSISEVKDW